MADPFRQVEPGEDLVIQAATWNTLLDVARSKSTGARPLPGLDRQGSIVRVKNETGADLGRCLVLGLGNPIFTPEDAAEDDFLREVTFRGKTPDVAKHRRRFCVLIDPLVADQVGRAYVAGVCVVEVDILDVHHEYATILDGSAARLASSRYGFAQILWREGGWEAPVPPPDPLPTLPTTGPQWCVVRLGAHCPSVAIGKASGAISPRVGATYGSGTVDIYRSAAGSESGPVESVAVLNASATLMTSPNGIDSGKYCSVAWDMDGTAWVSPLEC